MKDTPIITSLTDLDKYKFTMGYVFFCLFSNVLVRYRFKNRSKLNLLPYKAEIEAQLKHLCTLRFTPKELTSIQLRNPYFSTAWIEFLRNLQLNYDYLDIREVDGELYIGTHPNTPLIYTTWFETFILSIVQEIHTNHAFPNFDYTEAKRTLEGNIKDSNEFFRTVSNFSMAEFGGRRRFNSYWHEYVLTELKAGLPSNCFVGTSNMFYAQKLDLLDIGTMAHEYLQLGQGLDEVSLDKSLRYMLQKWLDVYDGKLGIALTDVVGFDAFLRDFAPHFANSFTGCRHDSGDPFIWGEKLIDHYKKLGINPVTKTAVFSDGVSFDLMFKLINRFRGRINISFGIGTNLVCDMGPLYKALQMVMKLVEVNGKPVAKIPDSKGKGMCEDPEHVELMKKIFKIKI